MDTVEFAYYSRARPFIAVGPRLGGPQAGYAVLLDGPLPPGAKLLDRQVAAHTCLLDADDADADSLDDGGFAPGGPVLDVGWREFESLSSGGRFGHPAEMGHC